MYIHPSFLTSIYQAFINLIQMLDIAQLYRFRIPINIKIHF